ncbi:MAG: hypothetical protein ABIH76_08460 [Candidatus Bathyarchaeota archaeon]
MAPWYVIYLCTTSITVLTLGILLNLYRWSSGISPETNRRTKVSLPKAIYLLLKVLIVDLFLMRQIYLRSYFRWVVHLLIFWGIIGLVSMDFALFYFEFFVPPSLPLIPVLLGVTPAAVALHLIPTLTVTEFIEILLDFFGMMVAVGCTIALVRRAVIGKVRSTTVEFDVTFPSWILASLGTGFLVEMSRWTIIDPSLYSALYLVHALISFSLVAYLPFSKFMHMFAKALILWVYEIKTEPYIEVPLAR